MDINGGDGTEEYFVKDLVMIHLRKRDEPLFISPRKRVGDARVSGPTAQGWGSKEI
jgi:hypothetical protein